MNISKIRKISVAALGLVAGLALASLADAATIVSGDFSIGLGRTSSSSQWTTIETASANILPSGGFAVNIEVSSGGWSSGGPTFQNRVLGAYGNNQSGSITNFLANVSGAYSGPAPIDAAANPNYKITLVITGISVYAAPSVAGSTQTINWIEVTDGHAQSQGPQSPSTAINWQNSAGYTNIVWDPDDFSKNIANLGDEQLRQFSLSSSAGNVWVLDGFQVYGYIELSYDTIPEPSTTGLLTAAGGFGLFLMRYRKNSMPCQRAV